MNLTKRGKYDKGISQASSTGYSRDFTPQAENPEFPCLALVLLVPIDRKGLSVAEVARFLRVTTSTVVCTSCLWLLGTNSKENKFIQQLRSTSCKKEFEKVSR